MSQDTEGVMYTMMDTGYEIIDTKDPIRRNKSTFQSGMFFAGIVRRMGLAYLGGLSDKPAYTRIGMN